MIKIKRIIAAGALSIFAFSAVGCEMIQKTPEAIKNTVLAKVGDVKITKGEVDEIADPFLQQQYGANYENNSGLTEQVKNTRIQAINLLVEEKMMLKKAEELGLIPSQEEVDTEVQKYIENLRESYGGEEQFNAALEQTGMTLDEYTTKLTESMKNKLITEKVTEDLFKDVNITDDEIKTYYEENKDSFGEANAEHIVVSDEAKAKEIRERIINGEDFSAVAKETSEEPAAAESGGNLGVIKFNTTEYDQDFVAGLKALKEGEISEPVKSQFGYHIIRATKVKQGTFDEVKDSIKTTLENKKKNEIYSSSIEQWKKDYNVKIYEDRL